MDRGLIEALADDEVIRILEKFVSTYYPYTGEIDIPDEIDYYDEESFLNRVEEGLRLKGHPIHRNGVYFKLLEYQRVSDDKQEESR